MWEGFHSTAAVAAVAAVPATATPAVAAAPAVNPGGKPMIGAHVRLNLIGDETGYAFNQMYLDGKTRSSVGFSIQYQPHAACAAVQTAAGCSVASNAGATAATAVLNDYKFFGGDAFFDTALPGNMEFAASASVVRWDYGDNAAASGAGTTGFARTGTGYTGELDFRVGQAAVYASFYKFGSDSGFPHTSDRRKFAAGLAYFIKGQADKVTLEFNHITPGTPGSPGAVAPTASNGGLQTALSTDAIWVQAQAAF